MLGMQKINLTENKLIKLDDDHDLFYNFLKALEEKMKNSRC